MTARRCEEFYVLTILTKEVVIASVVYNHEPCFRMSSISFLQNNQYKTIGTYNHPPAGGDQLNHLSADLPYLQQQGLGKKETGTLL